MKWHRKYGHIPVYHQRNVRQAHWQARGCDLLVTYRRNHDGSYRRHMWAIVVKGERETFFINSDPVRLRQLAEAVHNETSQAWEPGMPYWSGLRKVILKWAEFLGIEERYT